MRITGSRNWYITIAALTFLVVGGIAMGFSIALWAPAPPRTVLMSTGGAGDAYHSYGERYREILAKSGIDLRLLPSAGAIENLARLNDPASNVSIAFVQDGTTNRKDSPELVSLGTLCYEPLWFFYRGAYPGRKLEALRGKRIAVGPEGSASRTLALQMLARNGIERSVADLLPLPAETAADRLLQADIEAALIVASWDSTAVRRLISAPNVELLTFPRADAYVALYPFLTKLILPTGVADLAANRPPADVMLLAPKTSLAVRGDLHPAIQYLLLDAALQVHSGPGMFQKA